MCFVNDYDWYAAYTIDEIRVAGKPRKCGECGELITHGADYRYIYQQEHEECVCLKEQDVCDCETPEYGETFYFSICYRCNCILASIKEQEVSEGCKEDVSQPAFGELYEALLYDDENRYLERFYADFPTLKLPDKWAERLEEVNPN